MIAKIGNCYFKLLYIPIFFQKFQIRNTEFFFLDYRVLYENILYKINILKRNDIAKFYCYFCTIERVFIFCFVMLILINSWSLQTTIYQSFILQQKG